MKFTVPKRKLDFKEPVSKVAKQDKDKNINVPSTSGTRPTPAVPSTSSNVLDNDLSELDFEDEDLLKIPEIPPTGESAEEIEESCEIDSANQDVKKEGDI